MVAQIIISREDSVSFFAIGKVQDDASLVSALGGALTSFAIEMGLSDSDNTNANYSRFQNGVLISKWLEIDNYRPSLMIAIKDFDNLEQYHHLFLIDYGTILAEKIISTYERMYSGEGEIPRLVVAMKHLPEVAHKMYKNSPSTLKEFNQAISKYVYELLEDFWKNQNDKGLHPLSFRNEPYHQSKIPNILKEFRDNYYLEGVATDALFPLYFANASNMNPVDKTITDFLKGRAKQSEREIANEVSRIITQLRNVSRARSIRRKQDIETVDLINADVILEAISVAKEDEIVKVRTKILEELFQNLLQKLYQKYPLKYISAGLVNPITVDFIEEIFIKVTKPMLHSAFSDSEQLIKQATNIIGDIAVDFTPEEIIKNAEEIIDKVQYQFVRVIQKKDPFLILADPKLELINKMAHKYARQALEQYRTAHDEAMALYYIVRQINSSLMQLKSTTITKQISGYFLQELVRKYQFRVIPNIVYGLGKEILSELSTFTSAKDPVHRLLEKNISLFEKEAQFSIPKDIKKSIYNRFKKVEIAQQKFEHIEALSFFTQIYNSALESTIAKLLEMLFSTNNTPQPPKLLFRSIKKIIDSSQSLYSISNILQQLQKQPGAQEILKQESAKFLNKQVKISNIIPTPIELVRIAYNDGWIIDYHKKTKTTTKGTSKKQKASKKELVKLSDSRLLVRRVEIPKLKLKGKVTNLLKQSRVVQNLWLRYCNKAITARITQIRKYIKKIDEKIKTTAGSTSGKKRYATRLKKAKGLLKAYSQLASGGNIFGRIFLGKKDLAKITAQAVKQKFPGIRLHPDELVTNPKKNTIFGKKIVLNIPPMIGTYQRLTEVYAATWVKGSEFVRKLKDEIIWRILEKSSKKNFPLERKIIENLHSEARRGGKVDQETIVRTTIEQEVSLIFNNAVRTAIAYAFSSIKNDLLVRSDKRSKDFYIPIGVINISKNLLPSDYEKIKYAKFSKVADDKTEIRLNLSEILPEMSSRRKKSHSVRVFLRDGLMEYLRNNFFKAFNDLGEQTEKYIGEQAADLFFSHSRMLERLILEAIDES